MLNYDLQLKILNALASTYVDEKRMELTSKQFAVDQDTFVLNMTYLKREKLIDLSSLSSRAAVVVEGAGEVVTATKTLTAEGYMLARSIITHAGMKALAAASQIKLVVHP